MITRQPLVVKKTTLDATQEKEQLRAIAANFALYLSAYRADRKSKHSKMGPVGKILSRMRSGKRGEAMMGEAIRFHEMDARKHQREMTPEQYKALQTAIFDLSRKLNDDSVKIADRSRIISLVDAMVYYYLEKRRKDFFFLGIEQFGQFLQEKYGSVEAVSEAWGEKVDSWEAVPYPTKKLDKFKNPAIRGDVEAYLERSQGNENEEELEEEVEV